MVTLQVSDTYTNVVGASLQERECIRKVCSAHPQGYNFMPRYKDGTWDGLISLYKWNKFPTGLLERVKVVLTEAEYPFTVEDNLGGDFAIDFPTELGGVKLRDYQLEAVKACLIHERGVLRMATNSGKTLVAAALIQATGNRAVVIVPSRALLIQTADRLEKLLGVPVGRVGSGYMQDENVTVTTMASLEKVAAKDLSGNQTVICDEVQHLSSNQIFDHIFDIPGRYRIGMSGTPLKYEVLPDLKLVGATGEVIYEVSNKELIEDGYSVKPIIQFHNVNGEWNEYDYEDAYRANIVENDKRNALIGKIATEESTRGPVLVLVNWIQHAYAIASAAENATIATGNDSKDDIQNKLYKLGTKEIPILVATEIFGEGIDIPSISTVIMAAGGKSHIRLLQRVGRGLRVAEGKDRLVVHDFLDETNKHLLRHSEIRHKLYKAEGFEIKLVK